MLYVEIVALEYQESVVSDMTGSSGNARLSEYLKVPGEPQLGCLCDQSGGSWQKWSRE